MLLELCPAGAACVLLACCLRAACVLLAAAAGATAARVSAPLCVGAKHTAHRHSICTAAPRAVHTEWCG